ncbi:MAG TPA: asparaginase domain-containing protein [Conexibacter sp.]|nr:asparaginase domain-containing protein [Conexibacter sp.]
MSRPFNHSGAVPLGAFYVERQADRDYIAALRDVEGGPVHLHGSRQSGKSSLLLRARAALVDEHAVAYVDLAGLFAVAWADAREFGQRLASAIAEEIGLPPAEWHELAGREGWTRALIALCQELDRPAILIFDELDSLPGDFKRELCRALRSLYQARARIPELRVNVSLCGVEPPLGHFNGAAPREGLEPVGGRQLWLDDFPVDDATADRMCEGFAAGGLEVSREAARAILAHGGGYPQACTWLGNLVAERWRGAGIAFGQDFDQRLRELTRAAFDPAATAAWSTRQLLDMDTQWMRVIEGFLLEHGTTVREAVDVYQRVLDAFDGRRDPVAYVHGERAHELLRTSGLARLSAGDGRLRLRCPLFADAFDRAWIDRVERLPDVRARYYGRRRASVIDKRLLIIGTGGTIGMAEERRGRVAPPTGRAEWFRAVEELVTSVEFDERFDYDSADVGPEQWTDIVRAIVRRQGEFDGVVVAHGTDTMAYTASAVAFALGRDLGFPVVFTGSQTTVDVPHGDALANVLRAALVATQDVPEVVISFGEKVFRATRTQKKDDRRFDGFESPGYPELGFVAEEVQIFAQNVLAQTDRAPLTNVPMEFASGILHVSQVPGSEAKFYEAALEVLGDDGTPMCRGIVIQSLGAGNVPTKTEAFDLTRLIGAATERHVPVVLTSQYPVLPANYLRYSPSQAAIEAGAIPTGNMTISAVVTKLSWILPQVDHEVRQGLLVPKGRVKRVREMMGREYVGEGGLTVMDDPGAGGRD